MLKLLIVEDEKWEREGLMEFLDWGSLGLELSGSACDGFEGVDKARILHPDIIITDIKMPGMDGLKMSQIIREFIPEVKIVILTGYDDFKLAQEAINISANAYILKPVEEEELLDVLKRVMDECYSDAKKKEEQKMLKVLLDESFIKSRRELLLTLIKDEDSKDAVKKALDMRILPSAGNYSVIAFGPGKTGEISPAGEPAVKGSLAVELEGADTALRSDLIKAGINFATAVCDDDKAMFIVTTPKDMSPNGLINAAGIISDYYGKRGVGTLAGVGSPVEDMGELYRTGRQARESLDFASFWQETGIVDYAALVSLQQENAAKTGDFLAKGNAFTKRLMNALRAADIEMIDSLLDDMFKLVEESKWLDRNMITNFLYGLLNETSLIFGGANLKEQEEGAAGALLFGLKDYRSLKDYVYQFFEKSADTIRDKKNNKDEYIVKKVEQIVTERYRDDISIKTIAAEIYISPNYLGSIFRKCTGVQLNDYISRFRMEKAKELLQSPKNKVSKVAREVGMPNVSYFCQVFKEMYGIAPGEYQEINKLY